MAGFFGLFDYAKPGKGIEPDAPKKHPFFLFWELLWRKISRLVLVNVIYFAVLSPLITLVYMLLYTQLIESFPDMVYTPFASTLFSVAAWLLSHAPWLAYLLVGLSVVLYGPVTCGFTYILRNFAREEHAWLTDIIDRTKRNFRQGLLLGLMDIVVVVFLMYSISYTMGIVADSAAIGSMMTLSRYISMVVLVLYMFMRHYTYLLAVTFELKMIQIIKNSLLFTILALWRNLLVTVLIAVLVLAIFLIHPMVEFILIPLFLFSFCGFIGVFTTYPVVKRYMIDALIKKRGEQEDDSAEENLLNS